MVGSCVAHDRAVKPHSRLRSTADLDAVLSTDSIDCANASNPMTAAIKKLSSSCVPLSAYDGVGCCSMRGRPSSRRGDAGMRRSIPVIDATRRAHPHIWPAANK